MGENTFRYSPAALRVRFSAAESDDRGARAPAASQASGGAAIAGAGPAEPGAGATTALRGALAGTRAAIAAIRGAGVGSAGVADESASRHGSRANQGQGDGPGGPGGPAGPRAGGGSGGRVQAPAATYWRRRFIALAVGLTIFAMAAWTLSEALKVHPATSPPTRTPATSGRGHGAGHGGGPAGGQRAVTGTSRRDGHSPAGSHHGHATAGGRSRRRTHPSPAASGFGGFKPAFCSWHSIVLSLSASQVRFEPGQVPDFSLSVVSTQPKDCSFNVGAGHLAVVVKEGTATIWSSADCAGSSGTRSLVTALRRGVPTVVSIGWNRKTSAPGCSGPVRAVPAGTYTAYAADGSL